MAKPRRKHTDPMVRPATQEERRDYARSKRRSEYQNHVYQYFFILSIFCCVCDPFYTVFVYFVSVGLIFGWP